MAEATLPERVEAWRQKGGLEEFRGRRIHTFFQDGDGPLLVLLHGFPTCSYDWRYLVDLMPGRAILAFDFLGFGLSDKPRDHSYTLSWQADLTEELICRKWGNRPVCICAHDFGSSVATELLARDLADELRFDLGSMLLFNGSILVERSNPTLAQKLLRSPLGPLAARFSHEAFFRRQFASVFGGAHPMTDQDATDYWSLMTWNDGNRLGHKLVSYMDERVIYADRWHGAVSRWQGDLNLAWGMQDPVAVPAILDGLLEMRPDLPVTRMPELGHYPQVEDPAQFAQVLDRSLAASGTSL
ncbi:MAG: alpha/beta hydrolase [Solirubrobacterales bacterium]|nr:alpha/beta hydrolase [Solirubrobacterales bacterium]HMT05291.1 alpha/beta hydrolase [Solirubrobacterales bacterium]